jgi:hypothetical protein
MFSPAQRVLSWIPLAVDGAGLLAYTGMSVLLAESAAAGHRVHTTPIYSGQGTDDDPSSPAVVDSLLTIAIPVVVGEGVVILHDVIVGGLSGIQSLCNALCPSRFKRSRASFADWLLPEDACSPQVDGIHSLSIAELSDNELLYDIEDEEGGVEGIDQLVDHYRDDSNGTPMPFVIDYQLLLLLLLLLFL